MLQQQKQPTGPYIGHMPVLNLLWWNVHREGASMQLIDWIADQQHLECVVDACLWPRQPFDSKPAASEGRGFNRLLCNWTTRDLNRHPYCPVQLDQRQQVRAYPSLQEMLSNDAVWSAVPSGCCSPNR